MPVGVRVAFSKSTVFKIILKLRLKILEWVNASLVTYILGLSHNYSVVDKFEEKRARPFL